MVSLVCEGRIEVTPSIYFLKINKDNYLSYLSRYSYFYFLIQIFMIKMKHRM